MSRIESLKYCNRRSGVLVHCEGNEVGRRKNLRVSTVLVRLSQRRSMVLSHDRRRNDGFEDVMDVKEGSIEIRPSTMNHSLS